MADKEKEMEEAIKLVDTNPQYKVLTKEEYEILMGGAKPKTSTPRMPVPTPKVKLDFTPRAPSATPGTRLQQLINASQSQSFAAAPTYIPPKLPFFSGSEEPAKGETSYEVWNYEVKCLQKSDYLTEQVILNSIRASLRGAARELLVPLGEEASIDEVLQKLDGFYGNVSTAETIIQSFYNDCQKDNESVATFGSRLEQTLSRAIRYGHMELAAKDSMLRSKFWTGLKSHQLRNSTRYLYDTYKDFPSLLREIRKVEQEESCSQQRPVQPQSAVPSKQKVAQQQFGQVPADQTDNAQNIQKQMSDLMAMVKSLERKMELQQQAIAAANSQPTAQPTYNNANNQRGRGRGYRGQGQGRGNFGRGNSGNFGDSGNNRGGFKRGGYRGRGRGRGTNRGGGSGNDQSLNE